MTSSLPAHLKDPSLLVLDKTYINGQWVSSKSGETFEVTNPASDAVIGSLPESGLDDLNDAVQAASRALDSWKRRPGRQRSRILHKIYELLVEHQQDLAIIISAENGKAKADAIGEVL
jgi:succinate-semialdehyde dehydrogenase / glutarate-semialdehyde dehydrogenase